MVSPGPRAVPQGRTGSPCGKEAHPGGGQNLGWAGEPQRPGHRTSECPVSPSGHCKRALAPRPGPSPCGIYDPLSPSPGPSGNPGSQGEFWGTGGHPLAHCELSAWSLPESLADGKWRVPHSAPNRPVCTRGLHIPSPPEGKSPGARGAGASTPARGALLSHHPLCSGPQCPASASWPYASPCLPPSPTTPPTVSQPTTTCTRHFRFRVYCTMSCPLLLKQ